MIIVAWQWAILGGVLGAVIAVVAPALWNHYWGAWVTLYFVSVKGPGEKRVTRGERRGYEVGRQMVTRRSRRGYVESMKKYYGLRAATYQEYRDKLRWMDEQDNQNEEVVKWNKRMAEEKLKVTEKE